MLDLLGKTYEDSFEKEDEIVTVVRSTYNYDMFAKVNGNRTVDRGNYKKLKQSMVEEQLMIPIIVNEKYEIIDGQHRFEAAKELGLPVYYIICEGYGIEQVKRANIVSKTWKKQQFLDMYLAEDKEEYVIFNSLIQTYNIPIAVLIKMFAVIRGVPVTKVSLEFEEGEFVATEAMQIMKFMDDLEDFSGFEEYKTSNFITAFMRLYFRPDYLHEKMVNKLARRGSVLEPKTTINDYLNILCNEIYSYKATSDPIYFDKNKGKFYN